MNHATDEDYLRQESVNDMDRVKATDVYPSLRKQEYYSELSTGCWIDDRWGHYSSARLIQIAADLGWDDEDAIYLASVYFDHNNEMTADESQQVYDAATDAEDWLNENIAKPGFMMSWKDGEFFYMNDSWWDMDMDGDF